MKTFLVFVLLLVGASAVNAYPPPHVQYGYGYAPRYYNPYVPYSPYGGYYPHPPSYYVPPSYQYYAPPYVPQGGSFEGRNFRVWWGY